MKKIFILTGEPSGDKLASKVITKLKSSRSDIEYLSVGGEHLEAIGIKSLYDLKDVTYDILVFFSPSGIKSLFENFPDFKQNNTRIAVFGNTTIKAAKEHGLTADIKAPTPETPSMTMAISKYISEVNKK